MTPRLILAATLVSLIGACATAPSILSRAVIPVQGGVVMVGTSPPPSDSSEQHQAWCSYGDVVTPCQHIETTDFYSLGIPAVMDLVQAERLDSGTVHTLRIRFHDSMTVTAAATWTEGWLQRRPRSLSTTRAEWRDSKYRVVLANASGWRPVAIIGPVPPIPGVYPAVDPTQQWRACTEVDVSLCPRARGIGDWHPPAP
jgi:hypothetical protein